MLPLDFVTKLFRGTLVNWNVPNFPSLSKDITFLTISSDRHSTICFLLILSASIIVTIPKKRVVSWMVSLLPRVKNPLALIIWKDMLIRWANAIHTTLPQLIQAIDDLKLYKAPGLENIVTKMFRELP